MSDCYFIATFYYQNPVQSSGAEIFTTSRPARPMGKHACGIRIKIFAFLMEVNQVTEKVSIQSKI